MNIVIWYSQISHLQMDVLRQMKPIGQHNGSLNLDTLYREKSLCEIVYVTEDFIEGSRSEHYTKKSYFV